MIMSLKIENQILKAQIPALENLDMMWVETGVMRPGLSW